MIAGAGRCSSVQRQGLSLGSVAPSQAGTSEPGGPSSSSPSSSLGSAHISPPTCAAMATTNSFGTCVYRFATEASDQSMICMTAGTEP